MHLGGEAQSKKSTGISVDVKHFVCHRSLFLAWSFRGKQRGDQVVERKVRSRAQATEGEYESLTRAKKKN
jgi:hypothetical protein